MLAQIYKRDELNRVNSKIAQRQKVDRQQSEQIELHSGALLEKPELRAAESQPDKFFEEEKLDDATESMPGQTTGDDTEPTGQRELDSDEFEEEMTEESPSLVQPGWKISDAN